MKKSFVIVLAAAFIVLTGCSKKESSALRLGMMADVCAIPYYLADTRGYFKEEGLNVELQYFRSAQDRDSALQAKQLDGVSSDIVAMLLFQNNGTDLKAVTDTNGIFRIVGTAGLTGIQDVSGKKAGLSTSTLMEFALDYIIADESLQNVEKVHIPAMPARLQMLNEKQIDAAIMPEPFVTAALEAENVLLADIADYGLFPGVLLIDNEYIKANAKELKKLQDAFNKAVDYMNAADPADYMDAAAEVIGFQGDAMLKADFLPFNHMSQPDAESIAAANEWLLERQSVTKEFSYENLVYEIK